jgi:hypothetical protein
MTRVGEQGERIRLQAVQDFAQNERRVQRDADNERAAEAGRDMLVTMIVMGVVVHDVSVKTQS